MEDFTETEFTFSSKTRKVLVSKSGVRPVILLHEIFGVSPKLIDFARMIMAAGFRLYLPVLYGSADPKDGFLNRAARIAEFICVAREFRAFSANESGPWTNWLRQLVAQVCGQCGAKGAGVIGLCLTGNFALSTAADPRVLAPVMGEPSLPFRPPDGFHCSPSELQGVKRRIANEGLEVRAYRYSTDTICRCARFDKLSGELGIGFRGVSIPASKKLHSVFTEDLCDKRGQPRHDKVQEVIAFLSQRL